MPDSAVDDESRLRAALGSLASPAEGGTAQGRLIADAGGTKALAAFLREIEQTVLPRQLTINGGAGLVLICDVAERRILRLGHDETENGLSLSASDAQDVATQLRAFCDAAAEVYVRSGLKEQNQTVGAAGLSVADLMPYLPEGAPSPGQTVPVAAALAESARYALAVFDTGEGSDPGVTGQDSIGMQLRDLDEKHGPDPAHQRCQIWIGQVSDPFAVLRVSLADRRIWIAFDPAHLEACLCCWSHVG